MAKKRNKICKNCKKEKQRYIGDICADCWNNLNAHYCHSWDGMLIDKTWPEYRYCTCFDEYK